MCWDISTAFSRTVNFISIDIKRNFLIFSFHSISPCYSYRTSSLIQIIVPKVILHGTESLTMFIFWSVIFSFYRDFTDIKANLSQCQLINFTENRITISYYSITKKNISIFHRSQWNSTSHSIYQIFAFFKHSKLLNFVKNIIKILILRSTWK